MKPPAVKSDLAFRTIGEAADAIGVPHHVLRFWETRFPQLQPMKRGGGRRYYRPADMDLLRTIHAMLHDEGLTIRGAQKALGERGVGVRGATRQTAQAEPVEAGSHVGVAEPGFDRLSLSGMAGATNAPSIDLTSLRAIRNRLAAALAA